MSSFSTVQFALAVSLLLSAEVPADVPVVPEAPYAILAKRSHPPRYDLVSIYNPWGEEIVVQRDLSEDFGNWVVAAALVYADQKIRFDGYMGSEDDGSHYWAASDGKDGAWWGDSTRMRYSSATDGVADDLGERVWICLDLAVHAVTLAGFPLREAITADFESAPEVYTLGGTFPENLPINSRFFRRVRNLQTYLKRQQKFSEVRITKEQYRDPNFVPLEPFKPGDIALFGHYGDPEGTGGVWHPKHSGIVGSVDNRGLPVVIYNMRVSQGLVDTYDGKINQTRIIDGQEVRFARFSDRYSLIGFGRIVAPFVPPAPAAESAPETEIAPVDPATSAP